MRLLFPLSALPERRGIGRLVIFRVCWEGDIPMLITRVELENIKSYRRLTVDFRRGTSAIHGANGAGKTTLVEAIGFALFNYLPYSQAQFVREGEKYGRVVVHLVGSDDRTYEVERRCGAGASWLVYDCEADYRVEQRTDVMDKLHELFGIDRERPLDTLFQDALGVPQGSFTAIFLQKPSERKRTFDELLQIEDYANAAVYLLEAQKQYREQMQTQQAEIQRLQFETRDLENWRVALKDARQQDQQQKEQNAHWTQQLAHYKERSTVLTEQREHLARLQQQYEHSKTRYGNVQERLSDCLKALNSARTARQAVEVSSADYQLYLQAEETLKQLREQEKQRNKLRQSHAGLLSTLTRIQTNIANFHTRLAEVAAARQEVAELFPLVEQQAELEKQREVLTQQVTRHKELLKECARLGQQQAENREAQQRLQQQIAEIEPLQPLAARLNERIEKLTSLRLQQSERANKHRLLQEKQEALREKQNEREQTVARLRKAESDITKIEAHRQEAEELPGLQEQRELVSAQVHRLKGNIEGYVKSRAQSAGGQCPLLHETCLNIKQRGIASLESYFDSLLTEEHAQLAEVSQQQSLVETRIGQIKKYADALSRLGQYVVERDRAAEHVQRLAFEITRSEREVSSLEHELEALKLINQQIAAAKAAHDESEQADQQVRELVGLRKQLEQLQEQAQQRAIDLQERQQDVDALQESAGQLAEVKKQLTSLNDPRSRSRALYEVIKQEPTFQQQVQTEQQKLQEAEQQIQALNKQLEEYAELDVNVGRQEHARQQSRKGYQTYLQNEQTARLLPELEQTYEQMLSASQVAQQALQEAEETYLKAKAAFSEQELIQVNEMHKKLHGDLERLAEAMSNLQRHMNELEQKIARAEERLIELEEAQKEYRTLEELYAMMEQFRKVIKEAAPHVLKAMLADISAEANRIFGEIMGDRSAQLSWQNDYEIILRRQSVNRTFAQLSGGEQMSAALSVRLALLKKLSNLNIAFFDEPTQNMDELRRVNLAEQIRRVRGFDQLIVISHDDTFEQGLDSLVRLRKIDGETRQWAEDETMQEEREQARAHAS